MKGYKTVIFGVLIALLSVLSNTDMQAFIGENLPVVGGVTGTLIVVLRAITNSRIFKEE